MENNIDDLIIKIKELENTIKQLKTQIELTDKSILLNIQKELKKSQDKIIRDISSCVICHSNH